LGGTKFTGFYGGGESVHFAKIIGTVVTLVSLTTQVVAADSVAVNLRVLAQQVANLEATVAREHLTLSMVTHPRRCPIASARLRDIAEEMAAISESLADSKCYVKHADVISRINRLALGIKPTNANDLEPEEDGALVGSNPGVVVNVTQTVQNNQALIGGLANLAKDPDCLNAMQKKGHLRSIAETLSKFALISLIVPNPVGLGVSLALGATGGSLFILDRILELPHHWHDQKGRGEFLAMTCAFYALRTRLYDVDFFDYAPDNPTAKLTTAARLFDTAQLELQKLDQLALTWKQQRQQNMQKQLQNSVGVQEGELFFLIQDALALLRSDVAAGEKARDRLSILTFFIKNADAFSRLLQGSSIAPELGQRTMTLIREFMAQAPLQLMSLNRKAWQLASVMSLIHFLEEVLNASYPNLVKAVAGYHTMHEFSSVMDNQTFIMQTTAEIEQLHDRLQGLVTNLGKKIANLQRFSHQNTAQIGRDDGMENEFAIRQEYEKIAKKLTGKTGWSFVSYLYKTASNEFATYMRNISLWRRKLGIAEKNELCRDAFVVANSWDSANTSVELIYDYLQASQDLVSSFHHKWDCALGFIPFRINPAFKMIMGTRSVTKAVLYQEAETPQEKAKIATEIDGLWSGMRKNLGKLILAIKDQTQERRELDKFRDLNCRTM
jgi:hypothetical protein